MRQICFTVNFQYFRRSKKLISWCVFWLCFFLSLKLKTSDCQVSYFKFPIFLTNSYMCLPWPLSSNRNNYRFAFGFFISSNKGSCHGVSFSVSELLPLSSGKHFMAAMYSKQTRSGLWWIFLNLTAIALRDNRKGGTRQKMRLTSQKVSWT